MAADESGMKKGDESGIKMEYILSGLKMSEIGHLFENGGWV